MWNFRILRNFTKNLSLNCNKFLNRNHSAFSHNASVYDKINEKEFKVYPGFGTLFLNSHCNCVVKPADPQFHPDANYASVSLWGDKKKESNLNLNTSLIGDNANILKVEINAACDSEVYCEVKLPHKYDIEANMVKNACIQLESLEGETIEVNTQQGSIRTKNIRSGDIVFRTESGSVTAEGVLQGNIYLQAENSIFKATRLMGKELVIQGGFLSTEIESSYVDNGTIYVQNGDISIKNLHGATDLHLMNGKLSINGLHGILNAFVNDGEVVVHVSEVTDSSLIQVMRGTLSLSLLDASNQNLETSSPSVTVSPELASLGTLSQNNENSTFKLRLKCHTPDLIASLAIGNIDVSIRDWFTSLGIKT